MPLIGGARTDLTGLDEGEAQALYLLLAPALSNRSAIPDEARSAIRKLTQALPASFRDDAESAARSVLVDPAQWGAAPRPVRESLAVLQQSVVRRREIAFDYESRTGLGRRTAQPFGLVDKDGTWYLIAGTASGRRTYRVERMTAVTTTGSHFEPPSDFDLAAEWADVAARVEAERSRVWAVIETDAAAADVIRGQFGTYIEDLGVRHDDRHRLRVGAHLAVAIAEKLAGWGGRVVVLEPDVVRAELGRIGAELTRTYL